MTEVIRVAARGGPAGTWVTELRGTVPWRPHVIRGRVMPSGAGSGATVVLVQTAACLVAGDDVRLEVAVGAGARLDIRELGATIAHHARGGLRIRLAIEIAVQTDAVLTWAAAPLISAEGSALERSLRISLAAGATALLRESTVFGRAEQPAGALDSRLDATIDGEPLLHERLLTGDHSLARSPAIVGAARLLDSVLVLGRRGPGGSPDVMDLAGPGSVWRRLHGDTAELAAGDQIWKRWISMIDHVDQIRDKSS